VIFEDKEIEKILSDEGRVKKLLYLQKQKMGIDQNSLVFVGAANLAKYWWCAMQAVLHSKSEELSFFENYLYDRFSYAKTLIKKYKIPTKNEDILKVGDDITLKDINCLLEKKTVSSDYSFTMGIEDESQKLMFVPSNVSQEEREILEEQAEIDGYKIVTQENIPSVLNDLSPYSRGNIAENFISKKFPTIRWNFRIGKYICIAVPDGITKDFVYEFKSVGNEYLLNFTKPIAMVQADLYGHFFKRGKKKVEIFKVKDKTTEIWEEKIDTEKVAYTVEQFTNVEKGKLPKLPISWKCKRCDYQSECPVYYNFS